MTHHLAILVPLGAAVCGCLVLWANPARKANRAIFVGIVLVGLWISFRQWSSLHPESDAWFRLCLSLGPLILAQLICISSIISDARWIPKSGGNRNLLAAVLLLALIPWYNTFILPGAESANDKNGAAFYLYIIANPILYIVFCGLTLRRAGSLTGLPKLELQTIAFPGVALGILVSGLMIVRTMLPGKVPNESSHLLVLGFIVYLSYFLSTHRLFDAQYLFRVSGRYLLIVFASIFCGLSLDWVSAQTLPNWITFGLSASIALAFNHLWGRRLDQAFLSYSKVATARTLVLTAARSAQTEEALRIQLSKTIGGWANTDVQIIFPSVSKDESSIALAAEPDDPTYRALLSIGWVTPERLQRERTTPYSDILKEYLKNSGLGALLVSKSEAAPVLLGVHQRPTERPFTFPEILQLQEFASLAELAYIRVKLAEQTIQADRLATLGMLGASLAHEIRNPLYGIKSFIELIPGYYNRADSLKQVSDMLKAEIARLHELLTNMVNTAKSCDYTLVSTDLNRLVNGSIDLVYHKARSEDIVLKRDLNAPFDQIDTEPSAIKQVVLNLCLNAIQAQADSEEPKWIKVTTRNVPAGLELSVADNGPGIPLNKRSKLFERFHSNFARGTGLGLAISREIVGRLGAKMEIDDYEEGVGAVFRVTFPQPPASSAANLTSSPILTS